jgi:hypothetical protein
VTVPLAFLIDTNLLLLWAVLFGVLALAGECGFRLERLLIARRTTSDSERAGISTVTASMFALLAFTLGMTISFAQNRFEARRDLVVQEANTIGTAWLRARLIGGHGGLAIARLIEDYAKVRLDFTTVDRESDSQSTLARTNALQTEMWQLATDLAQRAPTPISASLIASLNDMFDVSLSQRFAFASRIPVGLAWTLLVGSMVAVGAMGYQLGATGSRQIALSVLSLIMWAGAMVLIVDFNRARLGTIRVDSAPLVWTIEGFGSSTPAK